MEYAWIYNILLVTLGASCLFPGYRLVAGPSLADRAIAFDNIAINFAGLLALLCIRMNSVDYIEAILVVALLGFLGTLSIARFIERGELIVPNFDVAQQSAGLAETVSTTGASPNVSPASPSLEKKQENRMITKATAKKDEMK